MRVSAATDNAVTLIAQGSGRTKSSVYRELVEKGLVAGGYRSGEQDMKGMIQETVQEALRPQVERLASIGAKGTQISAAAFFLAAYNGRAATPDYLKPEYEEMVAQARKLGVEYLKLSRDKSLDDFLSRFLGRMGVDED